MLEIYRAFGQFAPCDCGRSRRAVTVESDRIIISCRGCGRQVITDEVRAVEDWEEELRYNPNHDPSNGRFCSGSGTGGTIPSKRQTEPTDKNSRNNNIIGDLTYTTKSVTINMTVNAAGKPVKLVDHTEITEEPNSITQREAHVPGDPRTYIDRNFYGSDGRQTKQISNNGHHHTEAEKLGKHGEHAHDYVYDDDGNIIGRPMRELTDIERKENADIL